MAKYCKRCGARLDGETGLCPNCDAPNQSRALHASQLPYGQQNGTPGAANSGNAAGNSPRAPRPGGKKHRFRNVALLVLLLAVLAFGTAGVLAFLDVAEVPVLSAAMGKSDAATRTTFENGDTVNTPAKKHVAFDADSHVMYFDNQLIVYLFAELREETAAELAELVGGEIVGRISGAINALQIQVPPSSLEELESMASRLMQRPEVLFAGYDYPMQMEQTAADSNPWTGDSNNPDANRGDESNPQGNDWWAEAIGAYTAWESSGACQPIKVGILDSGFDADHEDLSGRITFLPAYPSNSEDSHGTHVAGIIGANDNALGIRGIASSAELVCVDWSPTSHENYLSTGEYMEIIKQLVENDVKVINNSWGKYFLSQEGYTRSIYGEDGDLKFLLEYLAIDTVGAYDFYVEYCEAFSKRTGFECIILITQLMLNGYDDFLVVQSAGNGKDNGGQGVDANYSGYFCAIDAECYSVLSESSQAQLAEKGIDFCAIDERVLIVGAVENTRDTRGYRMAGYSNYGAHVDLCAPGGKGGKGTGDGVFSTVLDNQYGEKSGTSMAAPMVAGSVAFLWSMRPELSAPEVRRILLESTTTQAYGVGDGASFSYPMLNLGAAVEAVEAGEPEEEENEFAEANIPADAVTYNGHFYYVYNIESITDWDTAQAYCEAQGGYLATVTSAEEDAFLYAYIVEAGYRSAMFGLTDQEQTDQWRWVTGEPYAYENWHAGEPNHQGGYEHYGMYYEKYTDGTWNDGGGKGGVFLCEWGAPGG